MLLLRCRRSCQAAASEVKRAAYHGGMTPEPTSPHVIALPDAAATEALGARIAAQLRPGDVVCLYGALGAGKTTLARGLIRACMGEHVEAPSPTFTLVQTYLAPKSLGGLEVVHADLYRLRSPDESVELGLADAFVSAATVIEWPERLGERLPDDRLEVHLEDADGGRSARLIGRGGWRERHAQL
jgi:tRNA threonylcarbamoyladenosine biosynthesis protein TsaE